MRVELSAEAVALRDEVRAYFAGIMTPAVRQELERGGVGCPLYLQIIHRLGKDGWLGMGWPRAFGGQERSPIEQVVFFDEVSRAGVPFPFLSINTVGPALMQWADEEQRQRFLPGILAGELQFAIGYTEPDAGTDLASLTTRAVRDGDSYVINGQKVFTTLADHADYIWLACRTDPDAPGHKGISVIVVPTDAPGFSVTPIFTLSERTNSTYYDDVRVPTANLIGAENDGWRVITTQLNHERLLIGCVCAVGRHLEDVIAWAARNRLTDGRPVIDLPWVQHHLARVTALAEYLKLRNWHAAWSMSEGRLDPATASATKVFSSEFYCEAYRLLLEVVGQHGYLRAGSEGAVLAGELEKAYGYVLLFTFGGGTNEIQRDIIATLGMSHQGGNQ